MCLMFYLVSQFSACLVPTLVAFQTPHYSYHGKTFYMFIRIETIKISFFLPKMLELVQIAGVNCGMRLQENAA